MTSIDLNAAVAAEHRHDLELSAARHHLAALARCCRPSAWRRAATVARAALRSAGDWLRRGELGPGGYCYTCS